MSMDPEFNENVRQPLREVVTSIKWLLGKFDRGVMTPKLGRQTIEELILKLSNVRNHLKLQEDD